MIGLKVREAVQYSVITQFIEGQLSESEVCERLKLHRSTLYRKVRRIDRSGPEGLIHGLRGRASNRGGDGKLKAEICRLFAEDYLPHGFRVAHFYQEEHQNFSKPVSYPTVLRWFKNEGLVQQSRKGVKHHCRRPRKEAFGEMLQMDTSIHDWLDWGKNIALISNIDDCTSRICGAHLTHADTTLGNMAVLKETIETYGLFASLYIDRSPIFKVTRTGHGGVNQVRGQAAYITQVQRALDELGIDMIYAYSPQAKGRIERNYRTWQSRLIPELRKEGIKELDCANAYIRDVYIPKVNHRFADEPSKYASAFVPLMGVDLDRHLAEKYHLTISNDHIVQSKRAGIMLRILPSKHRQSYAKAKVDVLKHTDGSISVYYREERLNHELC